MPHKAKPPLFFRVTAVIFGILAALILIESALRIGESLLNLRHKQQRMADPGTLIIFAGDSWTAGCDAQEGKGFFDILKNEEALKPFSLVNLGYGGNTCIMAANSVINQKTIPKIVVLTMGVNAWHFIGLEEFINTARNYLSEKEMRQLCNDFKFQARWSWAGRLKISKLFQYLAHAGGTRKDVNLKAMDEKLASPLFSKMFYDFIERYPGYAEQYAAMPEFLKEAKGLSLDQKFYFAAKNLAFETYRMRDVLTRAGMFYPQRLKAFPYDMYKELDIKGGWRKDLRECMLKWSSLLLRRWATENNVAVFIQTYPDIKRDEFGGYTFAKINAEIVMYAQKRKFRIIDHNRAGVDWTRYRTPWHVNNAGHELMAENIRNELLKFINTDKAIYSGGRHGN